MTSVTADVLQHFEVLGTIEALAAIFKVCFNFHLHHRVQVFFTIFKLEFLQNSVEGDNETHG